MSIKKISLLTCGLLGIFFLTGLPSCSEMPHAHPGFQPFPKPNEAQSEAIPLTLTAKEMERRQYEASMGGRLCYYGRVVDQYGKPVPEALVLIILERLGFDKATFVKCRTSTDNEGRFSVVGGVGTHARFLIYKAGYTPDGRRGSLRKGVDDFLNATLDAPKTISVWKNTGFDKSKLINHTPVAEYLRFHYTVPLPKQIRIDLIRGVVAKENEEWDVQLDYLLNDKGEIPAEETEKLNGRYLTYFFISINNGKMAYLDDPLPGFSRPCEGFSYRDVSGVFLNALKAPRLPYLYQAENRVFQFQSRGGKVHGSCVITDGSGGAPDGSVSFNVYAAVNPTGSPALFEIEPTEKDLSTEGYPLSE